MTTHVIDASYLIALANDQDSLHPKAIGFEPILAGSIRAMHSVALAEAVTMLTMKVKDDAQTARHVFDAIHDDVEIVHSSDDLLARGMALVEKDARLSLSDAMTIALTMERSARVVSFDSAFDRHVKRVP